jgi:hypothetical protein
MSLDFNKLTHLRDKGDKKTARCPACAADGGDSRGEHLAIFPDGKFGCVAHPKDKAHNQQIFKLVGMPDYTKSSGPIPVRIRRPECLTRKPRTLKVFNSLTAVRVPPTVLDEKPPARVETQSPTAGTQEKGEAPSSPPPHKPEAEMSPLLAKSRLLSSGLRVISLNGPHGLFTIGVKDGPDWQVKMEAAMARREQSRKRDGLAEN